MSVLISATILGLAWFAAVNAVVSLLAWPLSLLIADEIVPDARRSRLLLAVRFLPVVAAATISAALFVPAHVQLEPVNVNERYGVLLLVLAVAGLVLLGRSAVRVASVIVAFRRFTVATRDAASHPARKYLESRFVHGIALVGVFRPHVVVGTDTRRVLTNGELDVAIAHELAHRDARDNFARVLIFCVPDFLGFTTAARRIERLWDAHAECLADARAVDGSSRRATRLASALVKVARLRAPEIAGSVVWSLFHRAALLEIRVRRLVDRDPERIVSGYRRLPLPLVVALVIAAAWSVGLPFALHRLTELLIARLP